MNGISPAQQLADLAALVPPPDGWTKRDALLVVKLTDGLAMVNGVLVWGAFALHGSIDQEAAELLHLRLTHVPTGLRIASGADPLMLVKLARDWAPAADWERVGAEGIAPEAMRDAELCGRLGDLRDDFELWQRQLAAGQLDAGEGSA
jgi:hypothetical protein